MKLWVIEIHGEFGWQPTVGVGRTNLEAANVLNDWLKINTFDTFRITKYVREDKKCRSSKCSRATTIGLQKESAASVAVQ